MNVRYEHLQNVAVNEPLAAVLRRGRLARLKRLLRARNVGRLKFLYFSAEGARLATVIAWPDDPQVVRLGVPGAVREQVVTFFLGVVSQRFPTWSDAGAGDAGGIITWDLLSDDLKHRHSGLRRVEQTTVCNGL